MDKNWKGSESGPEVRKPLEISYRKGKRKKSFHQGEKDQCAKVRESYKVGV